MRFRGFLRAAVAAVAVSTAALAAPAITGQLTAQAGTGTVTPVHVTKVNLHAQFTQLLGHAKVGPEAGIVPPLGVAQPKTARTPNATPRSVTPDTCTEPNCNLPWNGGPVQHSPKVYLLFWGPNWETDAGQEASRSYVENLFTGLGTPSDTWSTIMTQYTDGTGHPAFGTKVLAAVDVDTSSPPSEVTPADLGSEAAAGASTFGITDLANDQVVVLSQSGTCFSDGFAGSSCQPVAAAYCGWHSAVSYGSGTLSFTNLPYQIDAGGSCGLGFINSPGTDDGFSIVGGHEYAETVTDPYPDSGYFDPNDTVSGGEIADKCAWAGEIWGTPDPAGDVTLSSGTFAMQSLWDNSRSSCQISSLPPQPTSVSTSLSGGGKSGLAITVPAGTAVTDAATLTGANAGSATGTMNYSIYSDAACTVLVSGGSLKTITSPGVMPAANPAALLAPGTYYWRASYSGDSANQPSASTCGPSGEVETVTKSATLVTTLLSGNGITGAASITVPSGATVRDAATLHGANATSETGTVTYRVYSNSTCTTQAVSPLTVTVSGGVVPKTPSLLLTKVGRYYLRAFYSGDSVHSASADNCGSEILTVRAVPVVDTTAHVGAKTSVTARLSTTAAGDLIVAYVAGRGPAKSAQTATVSGAGLTWHLVGRSNAGRGDAEVWWARAAGKLSLAKITAKERLTGWPVLLTVVSYKNAVSVGAHAAAHSTAGAPTGSLTTTYAGSWVWAAGDDWAKGIARTPVTGQEVVTEHTDSTDTYWVQATRKVTLPAGTRVTIKDSAPTRDPYNLVLVEIR